jgi:hypothetical protein
MMPLLRKLVYVFVFFFFLLPYLSRAQSNFKPGYVVNLKGDTLRGFIIYKEWNNNPQSIVFKTQLGQNDPQTFTAMQATAFGITGQTYYESHKVSISQDTVNVTSLRSQIDTITKNETVFLKVIIKGSRVAMYTYTDDIKSRYYLLEEGQSQPYELMYHAYYNSYQSATVQYVKRFRMQLQNLLQKNNIADVHLIRRVSQSEYYESEIAEIIGKINGNSGKQFQAPGLFGTRWFAGAALNNSKFQFSGEFVLANAPASNSALPKLDAGIDFLFNKNVQQLYLRLEGVFSYGHYDFSFYNSGSIPYEGTSSLNFKMYNTALVPQVVYNVYNAEKLKVFIDAGVAINIAFYDHHQLITNYGGSFPNAEYDNYPQFVKNYFSFPLKAGFAFNKKLEIFMCYVPPTNIAYVSQALTFQSNIGSYSAGLNYYFGK